MEPTLPLILDATLFAQFVRDHHHAELYLVAALVAHFAHKWMPLVYIILALAAAAGV